MNEKMMQAIERGRELPFAWVRTLSEVSLGTVPEKIELSELIEARFFSSTQEIRVFRSDNGWNVSERYEKQNGSEMLRVYSIGNPKFGKSLTVAQVLAEDEDGQVYVHDLRLCHWEGGV